MLLVSKNKLRIAVFNSATCPEAWAFLYRLCGRDKSKSKTSQEITDRWSAGMFALLLNELLHMTYSKLNPISICAPRRWLHSEQALEGVCPEGLSAGQLL